MCYKKRTNPLKKENYSLVDVLEHVCDAYDEVPAETVSPLIPRDKNKLKKRKSFEKNSNAMFKFHSPIPSL
jgi:hypothetical protein